MNGTLGVNHVDLFGISPKVQAKFSLFQEAVSLLDDSKFYMDIICSTMKNSPFTDLTLKQSGNLKYQIMKKNSIIDWELQQNVQEVYSLEIIQFLQRHFQVCDNLEELFDLGIVHKYLQLEWIIKTAKFVNLAIHEIFDQISGMHKGTLIGNLANFIDVFRIFTKKLNAFYKEPLNYFWVVESSIHQTKDQIILKNVFPIPEKKHFEKIFTIQPMTFLDSVSGKYKRVDIDKTNFVIRKNFIFEIKPSFLLNCKSFSGTMSCSQNGLFHSWTPCLESIYLSNNNNSKHCLDCQTVMDPRKKPIIERLNTEEMHFAQQFSIAISIDCTDGKYYTGEIMMGSGTMRVKKGCHLYSSYFSFRGEANQSDIFWILYDKNMNNCPEKASLYSNQNGGHNVHICIKVVSVILMYMKFC